MDGGSVIVGVGSDAGPADIVETVEEEEATAVTAIGSGVEASIPSAEPAPNPVSSDTIPPRYFKLGAALAAGFVGRLYGSLLGGG